MIDFLNNQKLTLLYFEHFSVKIDFFEPKFLQVYFDSSI